MKKFIVILFALMCLAQWIIPGKMVYESEHVIAEGTLYKFKTAPIDPSDPLRGKYVTLNFEENFIAFADSAEWQRGQKIFVTFTTDSAGFAVAENVYHSKPQTDTYLQTTVDYISHNKNDHKVWYKLPFNRFYMEESKAPQAEELYWQALRDTTQTPYGLVSIRHGQAILLDVIIDGKPIVDIINDINASQP
jgi:uncharacterized membrane-anchored protein